MREGKIIFKVSFHRKSTRRGWQVIDFRVKHITTLLHTHHAAADKKMLMKFVFVCLWKLIFLLHCAFETFVLDFAEVSSY